MYLLKLKNTYRWNYITVVLHFKNYNESVIISKIICHVNVKKIMIGTLNCLMCIIYNRDNNIIYLVLLFITMTVADVEILLTGMGNNGYSTDLFTTSIKKSTIVF